MILQIQGLTFMRLRSKAPMEDLNIQETLRSLIKKAIFVQEQMHLETQKYITKAL